MSERVYELAKKMADRIGHRMAEKCTRHAEVAMEEIDTLRAALTQARKEAFGEALITATKASTVQIGDAIYLTKIDAALDALRAKAEEE